MAMANTPHDADLDNSDVHHEESDVNIRAIFSFAIALFAVAAAVHVVIYVMFLFFNSREASGNAVRNYPLSAGQDDRLPPEPRLQTNPRQDLRDLRAGEDKILNGYRWVDRNGGVVGIPVSEAMKLTLQRGLPSRPAATEAPAPAASSRPSSSGNR